MTLEFKVAEGEPASYTIMEEAAAIWKYYTTADDVQELVDYLQVAINSERVKEDRGCDGSYYDRGVYPRVSYPKRR